MPAGLVRTRRAASRFAKQIPRRPLGKIIKFQLIHVDLVWAGRSAWKIASLAALCWMCTANVEEARGSNPRRSTITNRRGFEPEVQERRYFVATPP